MCCEQPHSFVPQPSAQGMSVHRTGNPAALFPTPQFTGNLRRQRRRSQQQCRCRSLPRGFDQRTEQFIGQRIEPAAHCQHAGIDHARIGRINPYSPSGHARSQFQRKQQQRQFGTSIGGKTPKAVRIGLQQFLTDPADTVCTRHRIDNPAPLVHQRQQAERQRSCTHIIDRKIFFQPVFRQPEAPVHHPGIIQQYRDLHLLRTQPPGKTTYRVQRGQIQRVKDHAAVARCAPSPPVAQVGPSPGSCRPSRPDTPPSPTARSVRRRSRPMPPLPRPNLSLRNPAVRPARRTCSRNLSCYTPQHHSLPDSPVYSPVCRPVPRQRP